MLLSGRFFVISLFYWAEGHIYSSTFRQPCLSECELDSLQHSQDFEVVLLSVIGGMWLGAGVKKNVCFTKNGWDYCSKFEGITCSGKICITQCQYTTWFPNSKGYWCYAIDDLGKVGWDYCSVYDSDRFVTSGDKIKFHIIFF